MNINVFSYRSTPPTALKCLVIQTHMAANRAFRSVNGASASSVDKVPAGIVSRNMICETPSARVGKSAFRIEGRSLRISLRIHVRQRSLKMQQQLGDIVGLLRELLVHHPAGWGGPGFGSSSAAVQTAAKMPHTIAIRMILPIDTLLSCYC